MSQQYHFLVKSKLAMLGASLLDHDYNLSKSLHAYCFDAIYKKKSFLPYPFSGKNNPNLDPGVQPVTKQSLPAKEWRAATQVSVFPVMKNS